MAASSVLLVDADPVASAEVAALLSGVGHTVTVVDDPDEAFRQAAGFGLVVIDVVTGPRDALDVCREIRGTPSLASIPVLCISQTSDVEGRIAFLEVGADDVVARPLDAREVEARVEALLNRFLRSRELAPVSQVIGSTAPSERRLVAVFSPKGGVGTTTIAVNLAVLAAARHPDSVLLVDLALPFGQAATHLDLKPTQTLADLVADTSALSEPELLRSYATRHESGVRVVAAPTDPSLSTTVTSRHVERLLTTASAGFGAVVVDAGSDLDERTLSVLDAVQVVVFPVVAEIPSLKALHALLDHLSESGSVGAKAIYVLNSLFAKEILRQRDVESALGTRIAAELPYEPFLYLKAANEGVPLVLGAPRSAPAEAMGKLAGQVFGEVMAIDSQDGEHHEARRPGRFGGLLRR